MTPLYNACCAGTWVGLMLAVIYARAHREREDELERQLKEFLSPRPALES